MLKTMKMRQLVLPIIGFLLGIGIVLTGVGFAMEGNFDYLKEDGEHKWYQIIYVNDDNQLRLNVSIGGLTVFGSGDGEMTPPQAPHAPRIDDIFKGD